MKMYNFYDSKTGTIGMMWTRNYRDVIKAMRSRRRQNENVGVELGDKIQLFQIESDFLSFLTAQGIGANGSRGMADKILTWQVVGIIGEDDEEVLLKYALTEVITDI